MISVEEVLFYHYRLIQEFGGTDGVRSQDLLESAIHRPFQTFGGEDLYPSSLHKAAALVESLVKNHPFIDGNKRTGFAMMRLLLLEGGLDIKADEDEKYQFVISISTSQLDFEDILTWLHEHVEQI